MPRSESSSTKNTRGLACMSWPSAASPTTPTLAKGPKHRGNRFPVIEFLTILAACLWAVFVVSIVLEAFDDDLDLWPFGSEDSTLAPQDPPPTGGQCVGPFSASNGAIQCFVMTAGAHLVVGHRARSALATDYPTASRAFNMAEPWVQDPKAAPLLGHLFSIMVSPEGPSYS
jgi:hypothetical protein